LKNRNIEGETKVFIDNKEFLNITHTGKMEKDIFELDTEIVL
jgi:hypothetical protein